MGYKYLYYSINVYLFCYHFCNIIESKGNSFCTHPYPNLSLSLPSLPSSLSLSFTVHLCVTNSATLALDISVCDLCVFPPPTLFLRYMRGLPFVWDATEWLMKQESQTTDNVVFEVDKLCQSPPAFPGDPLLSQAPPSLYPISQRSYSELDLHLVVNTWNSGLEVLKSGHTLETLLSDSSLVDQKIYYSVE